ncbi:MULTISPECIES: hypothetical protein [unclassified Streptomyces]|uniref:hypothetical protein n=1 Tax=unclassified Streptomyces TaxID=2593676 RepID=UPI001EFCED9E|nr:MULTISPECIES: hypothetical protein [unclassified Streptomyces]
MTCSASLVVPEHLRTEALGFPNGGPDEEPIAGLVVCELDKHPYSDHLAILRELRPEDGGAVWAVWAVWSGTGDATVRRLAHCPSRSPEQQDACWLVDGHRGGHTWERYKERTSLIGREPTPARWVSSAAQRPEPTGSTSMTALPVEPVIPMPPLTPDALRTAVERLTPSRTQTFVRDLVDATTSAQQLQSLAPLHAFVHV